MKPLPKIKPTIWNGTERRKNPEDQWEGKRKNISAERRMWAVERRKGPIREINLIPPYNNHREIKTTRRRKDSNRKKKQ